MAEEKPRLGRDVYLALAAVGWADGKLDQEEADAIVRTALEEGLDITEIAEIEAATKEPIDLGVIDRKNLSKEDRLFVYGVACWLTRLDGIVTESRPKRSPSWLRRSRCPRSLGPSSTASRKRSPTRAMTGRCAMT